MVPLFGTGMSAKPTYSLARAGSTAEPVASEGAPMVYPSSTVAVHIILAVLEMFASTVMVML